MTRTEYRKAAAAISAAVAANRAARNRELAPRGRQLVTRRELRAGHVVCAPATLEPLYEVVAVQPARASAYLVVDGTWLATRPSDNGARLGDPYRTSGHALDEILVLAPTPIRDR